jgi:hypothetical protein
MRYSGGEQARMLQCKDKEWIHGGRSGVAGNTFYGGLNVGRASPNSPNTDWVVVCGRNILTAGSAVTIINELQLTTESQMANLQQSGNCELTMNPDNYDGYPSDWQLSRLYVWNTHLPNDLFAQASSRLVNFLNSAEPSYDLPDLSPYNLFLGLFNIPRLIIGAKHLDNYYT